MSDSEQKTYATIALLTCLEALLGVINACLPVLKPVFDKMRHALPKGGDSTIKTFLSGSIPILFRLSHPLEKSVMKSTADDIHSPSPEPSEGAWIKDATAQAPKVERLIGMKVAEIYIRKDVDVESTWGCEQIPFGRGWEGSHDRW